MSDFKARLYGKTVDSEDTKTKIFLNSLSKDYNIIKQADDKNIIAPSMEYAKKLEKNILVLSQKMEILERKIRELQGINIRMKQFINRHDKKITVMESDIDNKIDRP